MVEDWIMVTCLLYVFVYFVCVCYGGLYLSCEYLVCSIRTTFLSFPFPTLSPPLKKRKQCINVQSSYQGYLDPT